MIFSLADRRQEHQEKKRIYLRWPSQALEWASDDRLILRKLEREVSFICLLDANLNEQKALRLPFATFYPAKIWSAGNYAVVEDTENHQLWVI
jgi:hypothetical protein